MSLWYKEVESITFSDIEAFCCQGIAEGLRLDYKSQIPGELQKLVAAFANTLGGLIIFGVEADKSTNKPVWPARGMPQVNGIEERITAICRDNIYPPVRPLVSGIIDNPAYPGTTLVVVRVDESPEAPHAVKGIIYERTGSQGKPHDLSHIDRISYLLRRRGRIEEQRRDQLDRELKRACSQLVEIRLRLGERSGLQRMPIEPPGPRGVPLRWASVIPVYPWRELCAPKDCFDALELFEFEGTSSRQRVPGGAFARIRTGIGMTDESGESGCFSISSKGHVFAMECAMETVSYAEMRLKLKKPKSAYPSLRLDHTKQFAVQVFQAASKFYRQPQVELPGYILLSIGLIDVLGSQMINDEGMSKAHQGSRFIDEDFGADVSVSAHQFLSSPLEAAKPLFEELKFGFDL